MRQIKEDESRRDVRRICGVALANRTVFPAIITAGLAVAICGELFTEQCDIDVLSKVLHEAEVHLGWPSLKVKDRLITFWRANQ